LEENLNDTLAVSENGMYRFPLIEKYVEGMALADRTLEDDIERDKIDTFNKKTNHYIKQNRIEQAEIVETLFATHPELNETQAKLLLTDSLGQHKIHKRRTSDAAKSGKKRVISMVKKEEKTQDKTFAEEQNEYYAEKVNVNKYLEEL
jgi:hypothetical protein